MLRLRICFNHGWLCAHCSGSAFNAYTLSLAFYDLSKPNLLLMRTSPPEVPMAFILGQVKLLKKNTLQFSEHTSHERQVFDISSGLSTIIYTEAEHICL